MKSIRLLGRLLVPASLVLLVACQSFPKKDTAATTSQTQTPAQTQAQPETTLQATGQGAPVAVFLADTASRDGWTPVAIHSGTLYVNPQPVITRDDLTGVKAGTNKQGDGLLALALNSAGQQKIVDITTRNPNRRLALVVGRTMMAAPSYTTPVRTEQLVFAVGTEQNATAAARAIAGAEAVPDSAQGAPAAGAATPAGTSPAR